MIVRELTLLAACAAPALYVGQAAAAGSRLVAAYAFTWAGIEVGELETEIVEAEGTYRVTWSGRTTGVVGLMFPFESHGSAAGQRAGAEFRSAQYASASEWRDGGGTWQVTFAHDGRAAAIEAPADDDRESVPVPLRMAPDPASLALAAIAAARPGVAMTANGYDGKRAIRFELDCDARMAADPAELACQIDGRLLAGASRRWQAQASATAERAPVRLWLRQEAAAGALWPVRLEASSGYGTVSGRLLRLDRVAVPPG